MKKIDLTIDESKALENFASSGHQAYPVLKKMFKHYQEDLGSVKNIDNKGNMGLQALARQNALEIVEEIAEKIFVDSPPVRREGGEKKIPQYR